MPETTKNIFIAFLLNLCFSLFEFIGGMLTGSTAIISDSIHDLGDAISIAISFFLEKKSRRHPDEFYTYGYGRYSVLGACITTAVLVASSILVISGSIIRLQSPGEIDYDGMIGLAIVGVIVNTIAAWTTHRGKSLNQKAVNLHMMEDVLGWVVVLIGAITMRIADLPLLDPILAIGVATYILINALKNFSSILDLFLEKTPKGLSADAVKKRLLELEGVISMHHLHLWSMEGVNHYATLHVVSNRRPAAPLKQEIRDALKAFGIQHVTIELETEEEYCAEQHCHPPVAKKRHNHHH